jgi:phosphotransferase system HPr (HPr) family protein
MTQTQEAVLTIAHPSGLHLRPAALFVKTAARFGSDIRIANLNRPDSPEVDAKSMFGLMQIGVSQDHQVRVRATGADAGDALAALQRLVDRNFEE